MMGIRTFAFASSCWKSSPLNPGSRTSRIRQHGTGGNLARVLQVLSKVIRDRAMMRKKIRAISAEGRLSALILSGLPFGIFAMISLTTPSYYGEVWDDPLFMPAMVTILILVALQAVILYRMVSFKF